MRISGDNTHTMRRRKEAAHRQRRLIINDDGDTVYDERTLGGVEDFCELRLKGFLGTPVDSISWCLMWGVGRAGEVRYWQTHMHGVPLLANIPDPTTIVENFTKENGLEIFGSLRMNDCHDAFGVPFQQLVYPLKVEHPEYLIGRESRQGRGKAGLYGNGLKYKRKDGRLSAAMWSGLDYAHKEVREDRLWWIERAATAYDLDGVDLNFYRNPWMFKVGQESRHMHLLTDMIRQARWRLDEISRQRGRVVLLGVRTPDTIETCLRIGLDIEALVNEQLVDRILAGGGDAAFSTPTEELVELGHRYEIPVYPCINVPETYELGADEGYAGLRGAASNMWWAGGDGIYLWNFAYLPTSHEGWGIPSAQDYGALKDIGDQERLRLTDKVFAISPTTWPAFVHATAPCPLPCVLGPRGGGGFCNLTVRVGDDVRGAIADGITPQVTLKLQVAGAVGGDLLHIGFNDLVIETVEIQPDGGEWIEQPLDPSAIKQGNNELEIVAIERGNGARETLVIERVKVHVRYRR